jgi:hypothetical protein
LRLPAPFQANIQSFSYRDDWYPAADGGGESLMIADLLIPARDWDEGMAWRAGALNGTPGTKWQVNAGDPQTTLISFGATLQGRLSPGWTPDLQWEQLDGPAPSGLSDSRALNPQVTFSLPGTYRFRLSAAEGASVVRAETTVTVDDMYLIWSARHRLQTGMTGDEDGDGIDNLMEYALDFDPRVPNQEWPLVPEEGRVRYTRFLRKSDLVYGGETSANLREWSRQTDRFLSSGPDQETRIFSLPDWDRGFVRLKIERSN